MNIMGNKKKCGANLKNDSLNVVTPPPPHVNSSLLKVYAKGKGDFREGNHPLDVCSVLKWINKKHQAV